MRIPGVIALAFVLAAATAAAAENLAPNPGFESDADGNGEPDGWWKWGGPGDKAPDNLRLCDKNPHSGRYCAEVRDSAVTGNFYTASQYVPVQPGHAYVMYVWARGQFLGQPIRIRIDELDANKKYHRTNDKIVRLTDKWQQYHVVAPRLADKTRFVQLSLQPCAGTYEATGVAWFDDVRFELADDRVRERVSGPEGPDWFPFPLDWRDGGPSPIDVTRALPVEKTGAHGFLTVRGGKFVFQDGTPARFWGLNIHSHSAAFPTKEQARSLARRLARLGVNLLRIHLLEYPSPAGLVLVTDKTSDRLDPERLERLDYLMAQLHENGIYVILDALPMCARRFSPGDKVAAFKELGLGAKGASYFDPRIIELARSYARQLLDHYNPYRGVRYVDDPTVALYEMSNEDALLLWWSWQLPGPYRRELQRLWNQWLLRNVGDRARLQRRWTDDLGNCALEADEDPARGTVRIQHGPPRHPLRRMDYQRFLADLQRGYWAEQVKFLRKLGVRVPICGTNIMRSPAMMASWEPLDFTDNHAYWDHPRFYRGHERWIANAPMVGADPLTAATLPVRLAMAHVAGKPAVATEWNACWPNQWRAVATVMTPAYALLNDLDAIFIYCYMGGWGLGPSNVRPKIHHATVIFSDPAETGLFPVLALMYRRGDVSPARNVVEMGISGTDAYLAGDMFTCYGDFQHFVPLICRWQSRIFADRYRPGAEVALTVTSGFSATGDYRAARRLLLWVGPRARDGRGTSRFASARLFDAALRPAGGADRVLVLSGQMPPGAKTSVTVPASAAVQVPAGRRWRPWLTGRASRGAEAALGVERSTDGRHVSLAPGAGLAVQGAPDLLARWFTDAARRWGLLKDGQGYNPHADEFVSDTGQLRWRPPEGVWTCAAPRVCIVAGFVGGKTLRAGALTVRAETRFGTYSLTSLDGKPLVKSRHLLLVAVGRAENAGQKIRELVFVEPGRPPEKIGRAEVLDVGHEPVMVQGLRAQVAMQTTVARRWRCWALDPAGKRMSAVDVTLRHGHLELSLGPQHRTIYYELQAP